MRDQSRVNEKSLSCYSIALPFSSGYIQEASHDKHVINIRYFCKYIINIYAYTYSYIYIIYIYFFSSDYIT